MKHPFIDHRRRHDDPKDTWDWICGICSDLMAALGAVALAAVIGFFAGYYFGQPDPVKIENAGPCGSCKKGENK